MCFRLAPDVLLAEEVSRCLEGVSRCLEGVSRCLEEVSRCLEGVSRCLEVNKSITTKCHSLCHLTVVRSLTSKKIS